MKKLLSIAAVMALVSANGDPFFYLPFAGTNHHTYLNSWPPFAGEPWTNSMPTNALEWPQWAAWRAFDTNFHIADFRLSAIEALPSTTAVSNALIADINSSSNSVISTVNGTINTASNSLQVQINNISNAVPYTLVFDATEVTNVGTTETVLWSNLIPANVLSAVGNTAWLHGGGGGGSNLVAFRCYIGGQLIHNETNVPGKAPRWLYEMRMTKTATSSVKIIDFLNPAGPNSQPLPVLFNIGLTTNIPIWVTAIGTTNADITGEEWKLAWEP